MLEEERREEREEKEEEGRGGKEKKFNIKGKYISISNYYLSRGSSSSLSLPSL